MAINQYHLLSFLPAVEAWEMPPALEALAQRLVLSGQLRINADSERNFVRHGTADSDKTFSARELTDAALLPRTRQMLARHVPPAAGDDAVEDLLARLRDELRKTRGIDAAKEMRVARCVVQATHPAVTMLLLASGTDVFVSYSHNVGDLLAVHEWQSHGDAGGLQATSDDGTAVFISCGGDPFFTGEQKTYVTDGFPALARMLVIGGQELGHFADLMRTEDGIVGRYSLSPAALAERRADMARLQVLERTLNRCGLPQLRRAENAAAFYHKRMRFAPPWIFCQLWRFVMWLGFLLRGWEHGAAMPLRTYPRYAHGEAWEIYLSDMAFNLAPVADAYRRADPEEEEQIACIEAVARVPQQVHKWGAHAVRFGWPRLYQTYYGQVIPACIAAAREVPPVKIDILQALMVWIRRRLRKRPSYYP